MASSSRRRRGEDADVALLLRARDRLEDEVVRHLVLPEHLPELREPFALPEVPAEAREALHVVLRGLAVRVPDVARGGELVPLRLRVLEDHALRRLVAVLHPLELSLREVAE